jgi:hypothetical protein
MQGDIKTGGHLFLENIEHSLAEVDARDPIATPGKLDTMTAGATSHVEYVMYGSYRVLLPYELEEINLALGYLAAHAGVGKPGKAIASGDGIIG